MDQDRDETGGDGAARERPADAAAQQGGKRRHEQGDVEREADQSLLGRDRDRLGVRDRRTRLLDLVEEGLAEGARSVAGEGAVRKQLEAAVDQRFAAAVDRAVVLDVARRRAADGDEGREGNQAHRGGRQRSAPAPAQQGDHAEAGDQRRKRGDRVAERKAGEANAASQQRESGIAPALLPGDARAERRDRERQIAPEDVRIEEDRVDPEVDVQLICVEQLRVEKEIADHVLAERHHGAADGNYGDRDQHSLEQVGVPRRLEQQHREHRERHQEEPRVLDRVGDIVGVGALERIEDEREAEGATQPHAPRRLGRLSHTGVVAGVEQVGDHSRADDQIERHEQVRRLAADLQRGPQRQD